MSEVAMVGAWATFEDFSHVDAKIALNIQRNQKYGNLRYPFIKPISIWG